MCPEWKTQQKILWAEVRKETGRRNDQWRIRDFLADEGCGRTVLGFRSVAGVGRWVLAEGDAVGEASEAELREWREDQEAEELGAGEGLPLFLPTPGFVASAEEE